MSLEVALNKLNVKDLRLVGNHLFVSQAGLSKQQLVSYIMLRLEAPQPPQPPQPTQPTDTQTDTAAIGKGPPLSPFDYPTESSTKKTKPKAKGKKQVMEEMHAMHARITTLEDKLKGTEGKATGSEGKATGSEGKATGSEGKEDSEEGKEGSDEGKEEKEGKEDSEEGKEDSEEGKEDENDEVGTQRT